MRIDYMHAITSMMRFGPPQDLTTCPSDGRHSTTPDKNIKRDPNRSGPNRSDDSCKRPSDPDRDRTDVDPLNRYILELAWDPVMATADRGDDWWDKYWDDESMRICKTSR
ncbi:hypothetical protein BC936DRAFT_140392 [Jimgerdemannia flammicorona]|uniref:Uncharacterized protein n=1 Tax=Jimgerdemannia flammicorona TaxID=994334 RepID=A0A433AUL2_9FUNG|nr:hypothetical protein BC936DRAFT_140392 [Jimgerdemannia flammicorona]